MKLLCLLLPHFPFTCEVQRRPVLKSHRALVTCTAGSQKLVLDYSPGLKGLWRGISLQEALGLHGEVELIPADMPCYRDSFNRILDSLEQKSPLVEGHDLGCAYLGLDGLEGIYRSDISLIDAVREVIAGVHGPMIGIAGSKFIAYLAALYSHPGNFRTVMDNTGAFLRDISCDVLPVSPASKKRLHDFGLHTLGQIAELPMGPLQAQFGPEGKRIWELARGCDRSPLSPRQKEEVIEEGATLPSMTVSLEAILAAIESLLSRAFSRERLKGKGIRKLTIRVQVWCSGYWERNINFKEPAMSVRPALSRVRDILSGSALPGPVEEIGLRLTGSSHERRHQTGLFPDLKARDRLREDITQMELRLGSPQVFTLKEVEPWSRIPERRQALTPLGR